MRINLPILRRSALVLLALMAVLCADREAMATCGDYLMVKGEHLSNAHQLTRPSADNASESLPTERQPCNGPICQNRPAPPIPPVPNQRISLERHDCTLAMIINVKVQKRFCGHIADSASLLAEGHPLSIDRPPQS
ncbi:MAG: hypothetical protein HUJ26_17390 [Planctomycetaceae bacterium]|nr:hypothetical protein [Planctomycetaceae bacterium]